MTVQKIAKVIGSSSELAALASKAQRLAQLQERYAKAAPPALARASRVAGFQSGTVVLWVDNAAVAAKLKQMAPRLMKALKEQAIEVTAIRVQVQPVRRTWAQKNAEQKRGMPDDALRHFNALHESLKDTRLKNAVASLIAHQRGNRRTVK